MEHHSLKLIGKKKLQWHKKTLPTLKQDEILVKTIAGAISIGAELPQFMESDRTEKFPRYPKETGYKSYGKVVEIGAGVKTIQKGDRVVSFYGHQDYEIVKENKAIRVPEGIYAPEALLSILSCDAAKGVLKLNPDRTDKVLVAGMGTMGLLTVYFLKEFMKVRHVDVIEPDFTRRNLALQFGAKNAFNQRAECPVNDYHYGLECSAHNEAFNGLQQSLLKNGSICILSDGNKERFELLPAFHEKELKIIGSSDGWDYQKHSEWYFENVQRTSTPLKKIFKRQIVKEDLIQCFHDLSVGNPNPIKVLVNY